MAVKVFNGTNVDAVLGTPSISTSSNTVTTSFVAGAARTAPNTTNKITGIVFYVNALPGVGDFVFEVRESGVSKITVTANRTDLQMGFNYVRFPTPYQFATVAANAYVPYVKNSGANSGSLARDGAMAGPLMVMTYDAATAIGATDDVMVMGFHDSGLTPKTLNLTGTANAWGSGQGAGMISTTTRVIGSALTIGCGGTVKFDQAADCKLTLYGNVFTTAGGTYDQRPGAASVSTLVFACDGDGDFGTYTASGSYGGQLLFAGTPVAVAATYTGGAGTTASPATFASAHGFSVGDELVIGWAGAYSQNEVRFVKSIPSPTSVVWSTTNGGPEAALTYTHSAGFPVANLTRNSVIASTNTNNGFNVYNMANSVSQPSDFSYTRFEYACCASGRGLQLSSTWAATPADGLVVYNNSRAGRPSITWSGSVVETLQDIVLFNTRGTNYSAQSGLMLTGASGKTIKNLYHYAEPGSTTCCAALSVYASTTNCAVDGLYSSGANAVASGGGYALGIYGSGNTFNDIVIDGSRLRAVTLDAGQGNEITNSRFGTVMSNAVDVYITTGVLAQANFLSCSFGSPTLLANYLASLRGTDIGFQDMDGDTSKHRWYASNASFVSAGAGQADTTVRTPGSLSLAIKPEDATDGTRNFVLRVPANPTSQVVFYGYLYRNAAFSSGDVLVDLFLPGTLLSETPDDSFSLPTTTDTWLPFVVSAYNPLTVARYAKIRITAKTATPGAYVFLDDIYDAGTGNKAAALDLWDDGHISPIIVAADYSTIPEQTRVAVWSDSNAYAVGSKGRSLSDTEANTDVTQAKMDTL